MDEFLIGVVCVCFFLLGLVLGAAGSNSSSNNPIPVESFTCSPTTELQQAQMNQSCLSAINKDNLVGDGKIESVILACQENAQKIHPCKIVTRHFYYADKDGKRETLNTPCEQAETAKEKKACGVK